MTGNNVIVDTNIFIDIMKGDEALVLKLNSFESVYISPIILAELYFGALRSANPDKNLQKISSIEERCKLLRIDAGTSEIFATIKIMLLQKGKPIPENDIWIAASAMQHALTVFTNDKHFELIEGLMLL
jgi:tRNA(fMet)-specific endonuclease VapC